MRKTVLIFGASGSIGFRVVKIMASSGYKIYAYTTNKSFKPNIVNVTWKNIESYDELGKLPAFSFVLICNGFFQPNKIKKINTDEIKKTIDINFRLPILITYQVLKTMEDNNDPRNIMILGSSSAYSGYSDSSVYCAAKHGLVGYIRSLNDEYSYSNVRFMLFSTGTIDNEMGKKVKTKGELLKPDEIATLIYENLIETSTSFQPEIIVRRRNIL